MKVNNCIRKENLQEKLIVDERIPAQTIYWLSIRKRIKGGKEKNILENLPTLKRFCQLLIIINYSSSWKQ